MPNLTLPKRYTAIIPLIGGQPKYPVSNLPQHTSEITTHFETQAREWINALIYIEQDANLPITREASFSVSHAAMYRTSRPCRDVSAVMS